MGKQKDSQLLTVKVTEANLSKVLREKFLDDEDFNGNNGEEYLSEEAAKKGFKSDKDMAYAKAEKKTAKLTGIKKVRTFVKTIVAALEEHGGSYYSNIEYKITPSGKHFIISVMSETQW